MTTAVLVCRGWDQYRDTALGPCPSLLGQPNMVHKGAPSVAAGQVADVDGVPLVRANRGAGEISSMAAVL